MATTYHLSRTQLGNDDDPSGRWQYEGGHVLDAKKNQIGWYASTKRVVFKATEAYNTAMLTLTLFFPARGETREPAPDTITLQGAHQFNSGNETGSVSAASTPFAAHIGKQFHRTGDDLTIN